MKFFAAIHDHLALAGPFDGEAALLRDRDVAIFSGEDKVLARASIGAQRLAVFGMVFCAVEAVEGHDFVGRIVACPTHRHI